MLTICSHVSNWEQLSQQMFVFYHWVPGGYNILGFIHIHVKLRDYLLTYMYWYDINNYVYKPHTRVYGYHLGPFSGGQYLTLSRGYVDNRIS